jgi:hypothetical protein
VGEAEFIIAIDDLSYSGLKKRIYDRPTRLKKILVPVSTIDSFLPELPAVKLIKLDIEGGEFHALKGAEETINRFRPVVIFECGQKSIEEYKITPADVIEFWQAKNYKIYDILGRPLGLEAFIKSALVQEVWDYVAIPAESPSIEEQLLNILKTDLASPLEAAKAGCG